MMKFDSEKSASAKSAPANALSEAASAQTMKAIAIDHAEKNKRGRYWTNTKAGEAELVYSLGAGDSMIIKSTFVPIDARGGGIALALVKQAVKDAKERGLKVDPVCPYVGRLFDRHPEWRDLRAS
jgi:hypothetical protein